MFPKSFLPVLFAGVAAVLPAAAQSPRLIQFRALCLGQVNGIQKVSIAGENGESVEVPLYTSGLSEVIQAPFSRAEVTFRAVAEGEDGAAAAGIPVAKGTLGKSSRQLFVFVPVAGEGDGLPYEMKAYDDDLSSFPAGCIRAINLAQVPIRFRVSGEAGPEIQSREYAIFRQPKRVNEYKMYPMIVEFRSNTGEWVKSHASSWKAHPDKREIVVTYVDPKYRQPTVKLFLDRPPWLRPEDGQDG